MVLIRKCDAMLHNGKSIFSPDSKQEVILPSKVCLRCSFHGRDTDTILVRPERTAPHTSPRQQEATHRENSGQTGTYNPTQPFSKISGKAGAWNRKASMEICQQTCCLKTVLDSVKHRQTMNLGRAPKIWTCKNSTEQENLGYRRGSPSRGRKT